MTPVYLEPKPAPYLAQQQQHQHLHLNPLGHDHADSLGQNQLTHEARADGGRGSAVHSPIKEDNDEQVLTGEGGGDAAAAVAAAVDEAVAPSASLDCDGRVLADHATELVHEAYVYSESGGIIC